MRFSEGFDHFERIREFGSETNAVRSSDNSVFPKARRPRDFAGFEEVVAHQILGGFTTFRIAIAKLRRDLFLKLK